MTHHRVGAWRHGAALVAGVLAGAMLAGPGARAQGKDLAVTGQGAPLAASVMAVGGAVIRIGDPVRFKAVSTRDGWGYVYAIGASGRVTAWGEAIRLSAGRPVTLPLGGKVARAVAPAGEETLVFVASTQRLNGFFGGRAVSSPQELPVTRWALTSTLDAELRLLPPGTATRTETQIRIVN